MSRLKSAFVKCKHCNNDYVPGITHSCFPEYVVEFKASPDAEALRLKIESMEKDIAILKERFLNK